MNFLDKVTNPTRFDMAPKGTLWKHDQNFWIQISDESNNGTAEWINLGDLLLKIFQKSILRHDFIKVCINILEEIKYQEKINLDPLIEELKNEKNNK